MFFGAGMQAAIFSKTAGPRVIHIANLQRTRSTTATLLDAVAMAQQQVSAKKQQGMSLIPKCLTLGSANVAAELQLQYTNYKNGLQQIAQKIGDVEQETEEHK